MANIFLIPNCPITEITVQSEDGALYKKPPSFLGYGKGNGLRRFKSFLPGFRDIYKRHPAAFGGHKGANAPQSGGSNMTISAKFVGNFWIIGITKTESGTPLSGCKVSLFRSVDDLFLDTVTSGEDGSFQFIMSNDSYHAYYLVAYLTGSPDVAGTTVNSLDTVNG